jgi:hypothetical protein
MEGGGGSSGWAAICSWILFTNRSIYAVFRGKGACTPIFLLAFAFMWGLETEVYGGGGVAVAGQPYVLGSCLHTVVHTLCFGGKGACTPIFLLAFAFMWGLET